MKVYWQPRVRALLSDPRLSILGAFAVSLIAFVLYIHTLAPSVTWKHDGADSGDLATAAFSLGIAHPPGYPLFTLLAAPFAHLAGVEPAEGVAIFAALAASMAIFVLARAAASLGGTLFEGGIAQQIPNLAVLGFAFAPALWSQATIAEVYTLNLFFVSIVLWAMISQNRHRVAIAAAAFGFGLAHHPSIVLLVPGAWIALRPSRRDLRSLLLVAAPLAIYAYLPLRAAALPPVNWGYPVTIEGFLWDVTAAPYHSYLLDLPVSDIAGRLAFSARLLFDQFTPLGVGLALWGAVRLVQFRAKIGSALILNAVLVLAYAVIYGSHDSFIYLLPAFAIVLLWVVFGSFDLMRLVQPVKEISTPANNARRRRQNTRQTGAQGAFSQKGRSGSLLAGGERGKKVALVAQRIVEVIVVAIFATLAIYNLITNFAVMDLATDNEARSYAQGIIEQVPNNAVIFAEGDEELFALVYYRYAIAFDRSEALIVSQGLLQYSWYYEEIVNKLKGTELPALSPDVDYGRRAAEIVNSTMAQDRANCFTDSSPLLTGFTYEDRYGLKCVVAKK